jgi:outer membrane protein assembly factor BamB
LSLHDRYNRSYAPTSGPDGSLGRRFHWHYPLPDGVPWTILNYSPPAVADGRIYATVAGVYVEGGTVATAETRAQGEVNALVAVDATTGELVWETPLPGDPAGYPPPVVVGDTVAVQRRGLYAFDATTGSRVWQHEDVSWMGTHPTGVGEAVLVADDNLGAFRAFDAADGSQRWSAPVTVEWVGNLPAVDGETAFVTSGTTATAQDLASGSRLWQTEHAAFGSIVSEGGVGVLSAPVLGPERVYAGASREMFYQRDFGGLVTFDRTDGTVDWTFDPVEEDDLPGTTPPPGSTDYRPEPSGLYGPPALVDGSLYVNGLLEGDPFLFALDAATGSVQWRTPTANPAMYAPVASDHVCVVSAEHVETVDRTTGDRLARRSTEFTHRLGLAPAIAGSTVAIPSRGGLVAYGP